MASKTQKRNHTYHKGHIALIVVGGILLVAIICFSVLAGIKYFGEDSETTTSDETSKVDVTEPEKESETIPEKDSDEDGTISPENDAKKKTEELEKQQSQEVEKNSNGLKKANVVLNDPYQTEDGKTIISSTITNVVETDGNCNYIFTNNSTSLTKKTRVLPNAKNTVCEAVVLDKGSLSAGEWKVRLEYKSKASEGVSETQTFTIK